jgi:general secretion pathway protein G
LIRFKTSRRTGGFSFVEVLVVLAVLGILSAMIIPSLLKALDKGRQKRTMADIRLLGSGIEAYALDNSTYPLGTDMGALAVLVPSYTDIVVTEDGWGHELVYDGVAKQYTLGSTGKDGGDFLVLVGDGGPTRRFEDDIVFRMGNFVQWPEGTQN